MDFEFDKLDKIENNNYSVENEYSLLQSRLTVTENYDSSARQGYSNVRKGKIRFISPGLL